LSGNQRDRKRIQRSLKKVFTPIRKLRKRVYLCTPETTTRLINEGKKEIKFFEDIEATTT